MNLRNQLMTDKNILLRAFKTRQDWRSWLQRHHTTETELWLLLYKKHTGKPSISLAEAVEEALCFGWIDGKLRRIDDEKHQVRFTPRKLGSTWSEINVNRVKRLIKEGRMTNAGLEKYMHGQRDPLTQLMRKNFRIPRYIADALKEDARGWKAFDRLPRSRKQQYVWWIASAKKDETRKNRIGETLRRCKTGKHTWWDDRAGENR